jgi:hypothetical protein
LTKATAGPLEQKVALVLVPAFGDVVSKMVTVAVSAPHGEVPVTV